MFLNSQMSISAYEVQCRSGPTFHQNRVGTFSQKCQLNCSHTVSLLKDLMNIQQTGARNAPTPPLFYLANTRLE